MLDAKCLFFNHATTEDENPNIYMEALIKTIDAPSRISGLSTLTIDIDRHELIYRFEQLVYIDEASLEDYQRECVNPY